LTSYLFAFSGDNNFQNISVFLPVILVSFSRLVNIATALPTFMSQYHSTKKPLLEIFNFITAIPGSEQHAGCQDSGSNSFLDTGLFDVTKEKDQIDVKPLQPGLIFVTGESGSGKTTFLKSIIDLVRSNSGFSLNGEKCSVKEVAYSSQLPAIYEATLFENLINQDSEEYFLKALERFSRHHGVDSKLMLEILPKISRTLSDNISGGERKRIGLIRSLLSGSDKKLFLLDEPTSELDEKNATLVKLLITEISTKSTVVVVTHDDQWVKSCQNLCRIIKF